MRASLQALESSPNYTSVVTESSLAAIFPVYDLIFVPKKIKSDSVSSHPAIGGGAYPSLCVSCIKISSSVVSSVVISTMVRPFICTMRSKAPTAARLGR